MTISLIRKVRRSIAPKGHVDAVTAQRIAGWATGSGQIDVEAWLEETCVARAATTIARPDVAMLYPQRAQAKMAGFVLDLPTDALGPEDLAELRIVARPRSRWRPATVIGRSRLAGKDLHQQMANADNSCIDGPFPRQVIDAIAARWPEDCADLASVAGQRRFAARLRQVFATPGLSALPAFADYARYLNTTMAHCQFVERHFPPYNARAATGANDFHCKPNSVRELFAIIHQLYVLKSWGVTGDFAEFGCFKGYSSAMLSFACAQLGIRMHIFDSFEGLPPAEGSGYLAGQYAGSLEEVTDHVTRFGCIEAVTFHKGFFADTFRNWRPDRLMCLWMDVDLEVSSRDLMVVADRIDPRASLFSHECPAEVFRDGEIARAPSPDNPIPPMLERHDELERPLTGRYIAGYTGAFWPREGGIPVADPDVVASLLKPAV